MKNSRYIIIIVITLLSMAGCSKFVEVELPPSQLTGVKVFSDPATANAAIVDVYTKLREVGWLAATQGATFSLGMYADELIYNRTDVENGIPYTNNILPTNTIASSLWNESYHQIYCANAVIEGVGHSTTLSTVDKQRFTAEATFIRALVHFYLVNVYGEVPYITSTDYQTNRLIARMPINLVYDNMIADLKLATQLLPESYVSADRARANRSAAWALLSRVYLYKGEWANAEQAAQMVIENPLYTWENNLDKVFLKESTATILQLATKLPGDNTPEGQKFIFFQGSTPSVVFNPALVKTFETGDLRKSSWIVTVSNGTNQQYQPFKYKQRVNTGTSKEFPVILRLAEQYLIRAEARAHQNKLPGAIADLNKIRNTAGLPNTIATTQNEMIAAVLKERSFELFTEHGHRFFDLKRTGKLDEALLGVKSGWETVDRLWPIPEKELIANPNLGAQNPGY